MGDIRRQNAAQQIGAKAPGQRPSSSTNNIRCQKMQRVHFHGTCNDPIELPQKHDETRRRHHIDSLAFEKFLELIQPFRREFDEVSRI